MMRVACFAFASLLFGCSFDASGNGSETGSSSETEGTGSGESSGGEAGTGDSGSGSGSTDSSSSTTDPTTGTDTDPTTGTDTDPTTGTDTDPTTGTDTDPTTGTDTDPTTGTDTDPTTGPDTDPTTGPDTDPTAGTDTDPTTGTDTGVQDCGEQPQEGPYAQCFESDQCSGADLCIPLQGSGGGIIDGHCTDFCEFDEQCPVPAGCDVQPRCQSLQSLDGDSACLLDCTQSQECPIGMECISVQLGYDICM
jgi:hypothetical protein